ncbi:MAG: tryptophan synthase subunit alpha [Ferrovum sp.]|nr:tryptophan synthase subunit alpha [Ferrovum sp.]NDU87116.1 tryptophan synthase subunit alpha [Ferrovum sp.]
MSRMASTFQRLAQQGRKALIPFFTVGDPQLELSLPVMQALVAEGADILELGIPFSDPMADGPTIQRASERALKNGVTLTDVLAVVTEFRRENQTTPVVLMGYANPIERLGLDTFATQCQAAGVDGVLVVDYPPFEARRLKEALGRYGIDMIFLLSPTSTEQRIREISELATGYLYYVSLRGVTGAGGVDLEEVKAQVQRIKTHTQIPVGVGFGIRDGHMARRMAAMADAVVVGSRLVEEIESSPSPEDVPQRVGSLIRQFRQTMDGVQ